MGWLKTFLFGLGAILRVLAEGIEGNRRAKARKAAQADADRINADPADVWMSRFKGGPTAPGPAPADPGKPDADA